ncbi:ferritin-like domain-containing protein [Spirosoma fluviale]|uniref:Ferritin-like n=1 Tax=Spirosoma fluviale TaxID=1597977 RepID=A0A286FGC0_9BACT|nr:ferritin-like protein [Spirosoma fluviale]SOD82287.1 Ferritin-like [Spirosoma fluviale]
MKPKIAQIFAQTNNAKRHKLIKRATHNANPDHSIKKGQTAGPIKTLDELKSALQTAIELEHSTIPPYLCALYSIKENSNRVATAIIRSVVVEEMLHMILAANLLNAIGGEPKINAKCLIPTYPAYLPNSDKSFKIDLAPFSKPTIKVFLQIEKPAPSPVKPKVKGYSTIGQFYSALMLGIEYVNEHTPGGIFSQDASQKKRQITTEHYYGGGGQIVPIYCIEDARLAIEEIVGQGEGIDGTIDDSDEKLFGEDFEYAHYFRFNELLCEQYYNIEDTPKEGPTGDKLPVDWEAVHNMKLNPTMRDFEDRPELMALAQSFNETYSTLLDNIHDACNGQPDQLMKGIGLMYQLKYKAIQLMNIPYKDGLMAGPTFEFYKNV